MSKTKIVICDNDSFSRDALKILLNKIPEVEIFGEFKNTNNLIYNIKKNTPDIVIYHLENNKIDDILEIKKILLRNPYIKIIVCSTYIDSRTIAVVFSAGAIGFLIKKDLSINCLSKALNNSLNNIHFLSKACKFKFGEISEMIQLNV